MSVQDKWRDTVTWSDGVFDSLERFVRTKPTEDIQTFVETGDLDDLYASVGQYPEPLPSGEQVEYMREFAEEFLDE